MPFDAALGQALREDARSVAVNEPFLAAILAQAYPNQPMTALDWYQGTPAIAKQHVARYRCVRAQVKRDFPADDGFFGTLLFNDRMFNFGGQDYLQLSAGRMHPPIFLHDVEKPCEQGLDRPLRYFRGRRAN